MLYTAQTYLEYIFLGGRDLSEFGIVAPAEVWWREHLKYTGKIHQTLSRAFDINISMNNIFCFEPSVFLPLSLCLSVAVFDVLWLWRQKAMRSRRNIGMVTSWSITQRERA